MPGMMKAQGIAEDTMVPRGRWVMIFVSVFLLAQLLLPLRYYLGSQTTDERFAWRMFSSVKMRDTQATLYETIEKDGKRVERVVPSGMLNNWQNLLDQGRPDVVEKMMRWLAGRPEVVAVRCELRGKSPDGSEVEPMVWRLDRATGRIELDGRGVP